MWRQVCWYCGAGKEQVKSHVLRVTNQLLPPYCGGEEQVESGIASD